MFHAQKRTNMALPSLAALLHTPREGRTGAVFDDDRLDVDVLASIVASGDCTSALRLAASSRSVRNLMRFDYFWNQVARIKGISVQADASTSFQSFFVACYAAERTAVALQQTLDAALRTAVETRRWIDAAAAVVAGADPNAPTPVLDSLRPFELGSGWLVVKGPKYEFVQTAMLYGARVERLVSPYEQAEIVQNAIFGMNKAALSFVKRMNFVGWNHESVANGSVLPAPMGDGHLASILQGADVSDDDAVVLKTIKRLRYPLQKHTILRYQPRYDADESLGRFEERLGGYLGRLSDLFAPSDALDAMLQEHRERQERYMRDDDQLNKTRTQIEADRRALARRDEDARKQLQAERRARQARDDRDREERARRFAADWDATVDDAATHVRATSAAAQLRASARAQRARASNAALVRVRVQSQARSMRNALFDDAPDVLSQLVELRGRAPVAGWRTARSLLIDLIAASPALAAGFMQPPPAQWPIGDDDELLLLMLSMDEASGLPDVARRLAIGPDANDRPARPARPTHCTPEALLAAH